MNDTKPEQVGKVLSDMTDVGLIRSELAIRAQNAAQARAQDAGVPREMPAKPQHALYAALARAQGKFPDFPKSTHVTVTMKNGGQYSYDYAPLDQLVKAARPIIAAEGLSWTQSTEGDKLHTDIFHKDGGHIRRGVVDIVQKQEFDQAGRAKAVSPQDYGGALSFARRYSFSAAFGIVSEEDDDANGTMGHDHQIQDKRQSRPAAQPQQPPPPEDEVPFDDGPELAPEDLPRSGSKEVLKQAVLAFEHGNMEQALVTLKVISQAMKNGEPVPGGFPGWRSFEAISDKSLGFCWKRFNEMRLAQREPGDE